MSDKTTSSSAEWAPCPFCGSVPYPEGEGFEHHQTDNCVLDSLWMRADELTEWNTRVQRTAVAASQTADPVANAGCRQQVKVKPLVWYENPDIGEGGFIAKGIFDAAYHAMDDGWSYYRRGLWADAASLSAAKAAAQADYEGRILAALEPAPVAPSLRITGPNSDGEYWLHIKAGGRFGGVNLGGERGPICKQLLDAASETGAKE